MQNVIQVSEFIRVEPRKPRRTAVASKELLADSVTAPRYRLGGPDGKGAVIKIGKEMTFLDDYAQDVWCVYREEDVVEQDRDGRDVELRRYLEKSVWPTMEEAVQAATKLATEEN